MVKKEIFSAGIVGLCCEMRVLKVLVKPVLKE